MKYQLSQLVNTPSRRVLPSSPLAVSNSHSDDACIDLEKSTLSIFINSPQKKRFRREIDAPEKKIVPFFRGQPIKLHLEIHLNRPMAEGSSLVLFSAFLKDDRAGLDMAPSRSRLWNRIRNLTKRRTYKNHNNLVQSAMVHSNTHNVHFESIDVKSDGTVAFKLPVPVSRTKRKDQTVSAPMLFRYWSINPKTDQKKVFPLIIETAMLNQKNPQEPLLRLSMKEKDKSISSLGVLLPADYWQNMIFLFCKPSYAVFSILADDKSAQKIETVTIYRSDAKSVKMSATVEKQYRSFIELEFITSNMCRIRLMVREAQEALKLSGRDRLILNLSFVDKISNQILKCHIPVKIALACNGEVGE